LRLDLKDLRLDLGLEACDLRLAQVLTSFTDRRQGLADKILIFAVLEW